MESNKFENLYSAKVKAGKRRTYFFDVRRTKGDDFYVTLTESTRKFNDDGYERHKIFLYKEDFNRFLEGLTDVINHVKTELMPDYDYDEFARRYEEGAEGHANTAKPSVEPSNELSKEEPVATPTPPKSEADIEDEMSW